MITILLVIHIIVAIALVGVILVQQSEGGASGLVSSNMGGFMSVRGTSNLLTRTTAVLATCFILTSLGLGILAKRNAEPKSIVAGVQKKAPSPKPAPQKNSVPEVPVN